MDGELYILKYSSIKNYKRQKTSWVLSRKCLLFLKKEWGKSNRNLFDHFIFDKRLSVVKSAKLKENLQAVIVTNFMGGRTDRPETW